MSRTPIYLLSLLFAVAPLSHAQPANEQGGDTRQFVSMPDQARTFMRQDMLQMLTSVNEILGLLADNKLAAAADIAENKIGKSAMGKHRGSEFAPGRYMPLAMRNLAWSMHDTGSEFAEVAKQGDQAAAYRALQKITANCVACHNIYRTQ